MRGRAPWDRQTGLCVASGRQLTLDEWKAAARRDDAKTYRETYVMTCPECKRLVGVSLVNRRKIRAHRGDRP